MGFFKWINRALFGAESAAKSAGRKVKEGGEETMEELSKRAEELYKKGKAKAGQYEREADKKWKSARDQAEETVDEYSRAFEEKLDQARLKAEELAENVFKKEQKPVSGETADPKEAAAKAKSRAEEFLEKAGSEFSDQMLQLGKKGEEMAQSAREKLKKYKEKLDAKLDEMVERAEEMKRREEEEEKNNPTGIREDSTHADALKGSTFSGTDDFFDKAQAFAEGDYAGASGKPKIEKKETKKKKPEGKLPGFEDLDQDGDELVDDAILDEEE